jgi:hypothetical protein
MRTNRQQHAADKPVAKKKKHAANKKNMQQN